MKTRVCLQYFVNDCSNCILLTSYALSDYKINTVRVFNVCVSCFDFKNVLSINSEKEFR